MSSISSNTSSRKILRQISKSLSERRRRRRRVKNCLGGEQFPDRRRATVRWNPCLLLHQTPQSSGSHWCGLQDRCFLGEIKREEDEIGSDGTRLLPLGLFVLVRRSSPSHCRLSLSLFVYYYYYYFICH